MKYDKTDMLGNDVLEHANNMKACWVPGLGTHLAFWKSLKIQLVKIYKLILEYSSGKQCLAHFKESNKDLGNQKQGAFTSGFDKPYEIGIS